MVLLRKTKICKRLSYMDTDSFIVYLKTGDIYKDIAEDVETRLDISNYENRTIPKGNSKKVMDVIKDELNGKITK